MKPVRLATGLHMRLAMRVTLRRDNSREGGGEGIPSCVMPVAMKRRARTFEMFRKTNKNQYNER